MGRLQDVQVDHPQLLLVAALGREPANLGGEDHKPHAVPGVDDVQAFLDLGLDIAQLFMGRASASSYHVAGRAGHLERRFAGRWQLPAGRQRSGGSPIETLPLIRLGGSSVGHFGAATQETPIGCGVVEQLAFDGLH